MKEVTTWPGWDCVRQIGAGSFGKVYEIQKEENGKILKSALKVISIPQNAQDLENILDESMDEMEATKYFKSFVDAVTNEFVLMASLKGQKNIVSYEDHMVIEREGEIGWDILIKMELLTPLMKWCVEHPLSEADVVRLGCDMSRALELCHSKKIIHRDIKPQNIFVDKDGNFKLGDFGIARVVEKTSSVMSQKGTYTYMAPEVFKGQHYTVTADIYSLGVVLYRFLNQNRTPFLPLGGLNFTDHQIAQDKRMSGEKVPAPVLGSEQLKEIVLKSLEFESKDRVQTAEELRTLLEACTVFEKEEDMPKVQIQTEEDIDEELTRAVKVEPQRSEEFAEEEGEPEGNKKEEPSAVPNKETVFEQPKKEKSKPVVKESEKVGEASVAEQPKKKNTGLMIAVLALVIVAAVIGVLMSSTSTDNTPGQYDEAKNTDSNMSSQYVLANPNWMLAMDSEFVHLRDTYTGEIYSKQESFNLIENVISSNEKFIEISKSDSAYMIEACDSGGASIITVELVNGEVIDFQIFVFNEKGSNEVQFESREKIVLKRNEAVTVKIDFSYVDPRLGDDFFYDFRMMDIEHRSDVVFENAVEIENGIQIDMKYVGEESFKDILTVYAGEVDDDNYLNIWGAYRVPIECE